MMRFRRAVVLCSGVLAILGCAQDATVGPRAPARTAVSSAAGGGPAHLTVSANRDYLIAREGVRLYVTVQDMNGGVVAPVEPVAYRVVAGPAQVSADGLVSRAGIGRVQVEARSGTLADTIRMRAVPGDRRFRGFWRAFSPTCTAAGWHVEGATIEFADDTTADLRFDAVYTDRNNSITRGKGGVRFYRLAPDTAPVRAIRWLRAKQPNRYVDFDTMSVDMSPYWCYQAGADRFARDEDWQFQRILAAKAITLTAGGATGFIYLAGVGASDADTVPSFSGQAETSWVSSDTTVAAIRPDGGSLHAVWPLAVGTTFVTIRVRGRATSLAVHVTAP